MGPAIYSSSPQKPVHKAAVESTIEGEWLWGKIDDYGNLVESSYFPMVGSRVFPSMPTEAGVASKQARFKIDKQGIIFDGSPLNLNGRKLMLPGRPSPALGRVDTVTPDCTWKPDDDGGWT
jgi:hypothetical protein